jgi:hypothetical protein
MAEKEKKHMKLGGPLPPIMLPAKTAGTKPLRIEEF